MKLMDVTVEQIDRMMARVEADDPAVYEPFGVGAHFKMMQDNLTLNLVGVFVADPIPEGDEDAERRIAYEMHVQDCAECGITPFGEALAMQWLEDSYEATVNWCIDQGII